MPPPDPASSDRSALRQRLLSLRRQFVASLEFGPASAALAAHLASVLHQLDPQCLGLYWPLRGEFNAALPVPDDLKTLVAPRALPHAQRDPNQMRFRLWDGAEPIARDGCDIPTAEGEWVVPDVLLVPCVGFTAEGFRLGYGGGYYDRYLAAHPHVTAIGVAWSLAELPADAFTPEAHDLPMMAVVTERGVAG